ncbi:MAG: PocR ligand-binding domain-containing protein [Firmicutes bacterium]|nr:PocR ligand-binding domain-containing protein [Bacillota bacterium]
MPDPITSMQFDEKLARECAAAFSGATGLGCIVCSAGGSVLFSQGYSCAGCRMCRAAGLSPEDCRQSQLYGMSEAERFGGKYIYFCRMGLTCFVSPIAGENGSAARITVGPFLMVDPQDYIACDLCECLHLSGDALSAAAEELKQVPCVPAERVHSFSTLLFLAVGFMNHVSAANRMMETQESGQIQGQINSYILQLKNSGQPVSYPFDTERELLNAVAHGERTEAQRLLNELLGHIFFSSGGSLEEMKARIYELLVLISRRTIDVGADPVSTLKLSREFLQTIPQLPDSNELCLWLSDVLNRLMDGVFRFSDAKHADLMHKTLQYLHTHYTERITMEEMARRVFLSPAYFSRVFKQETGETFNNCLNRIRIEKSKELLLHQNLRLTDIAQLTGFEDQSYFTKVFRRITGVPPMKFRENKGILQQKPQTEEIHS